MNPTPATTPPAAVPAQTRAEREFEHVLRCVKYVVKNGHTGPLSTGESLAGALGAGNMKALAELGYTVPEALRRIGPSWVVILMSDEMCDELRA